MFKKIINRFIEDRTKDKIIFLIMVGMFLIVADAIKITTPRDIIEDDERGVCVSLKDLHQEDKDNIKWTFVYAMNGQLITTTTNCNED